LGVRYLGLDVGDRRIGVALSDETGTLATGLETIERVGPRKDPRAVAAVVGKSEATEVVVGLPRTLEGLVGPQAEKVLAFVEQLRAVVKVPIVLWDERFTSVIAQQALIEAGVSRKDRKLSVDKISAVLILQNYLDYLKVGTAPPPGPSA
jgi:putative Holliday junction resolvase